MTRPGVAPKHVSSVVIAGFGDNIENCLADTALALFSLTTDITSVHLTQIITFEFTAANYETALLLWLNKLLKEARAHEMIWGDFRLKREGMIWRATVSGESRREQALRDCAIKAINLEGLSIKKENYVWEARCTVQVALQKEAS